MTTTITTTETVEDANLEMVEQHRLYRVNTDELTVCTTTAPGWVEQPLAQHGEWVDLNADGEPCADLGELRDFIRGLHGIGAFDASVRDEMLEAIAGETTTTTEPGHFNYTMLDEKHRYWRDRHFDVIDFEERVPDGAGGWGWCAVLHEGARIRLLNKLLKKHGI